MTNLTKPEMISVDAVFVVICPVSPEPTDSMCAGRDSPVQKYWTVTRHLPRSKRSTLTLRISVFCAGVGVGVGTGLETFTLTWSWLLVFLQNAMSVYVVVVPGETTKLLGDATPLVPFGVCRETEVAFVTRPQLNVEDWPF